MVMNKEKKQGIGWSNTIIGPFVLFFGLFSILSLNTPLVSITSLLICIDLGLVGMKLEKNSKRGFVLDKKC